MHKIKNMYTTHNHHLLLFYYKTNKKNEHIHLDHKTHQEEKRKKNCNIIITISKNSSLQTTG